MLGELGVERPLRGASWHDTVALPAAGRWSEIPSDRIEVPAAADAVLAVGGGSAIDTAKAASAVSGLPLVSVPTTYSGAEWTDSYGVRAPDRRIVGRGSGARLAAAVYEVRLTLDLPRAETVGTALNALAHCAEALYAGPCEDASVGARMIARALPEVAADGRDLEARTSLLEGALHAGRALAERGLFLAHAMAQALGGRYGVSHGAANALCLAPALRFNEPAVPAAIAALGEAMSSGDVFARIEELARLGGFERLRDLGVPEEELAALAAETADRPGSRANPRPVAPADAEALFRSIW